MPSEAQTLDRVFHCLANSTRRALVEHLAMHPASLSELAEPFEMALPSLLQHLQLLEETGLVSSTKTGRVRTFELNPPAILMAENWLDIQRRQWTSRLDRLDSLLINLNEKPNHE